MVLNVKDMVLEKGKCTFFIKRPMKTTIPDFHQSPIAFSEYPSNTKICSVTAITHYLEITKDLRITESPPARLARGAKDYLGKQELILKIISHTQKKSAYTSKAKIKGLSLTEINKAAGWKETSNFGRFYGKPIYKTFEDFVTP